jgi:hypothetical protein
MENNCQKIIDVFNNILLQCKSNTEEIELQEPQNDFHIYQCPQMTDFINKTKIGKIDVIVNDSKTESNKKYKAELDLDNRVFIVENMNLSKTRE